VGTAVRITEDAIESEVRRAEKAMLSVASELRTLAESLEGDGTENTRGIFLAEAQFAEDPQARLLVTQLIEHRLFTAELAVKEVFERFASEIERSGDSAISSSSADVLHICSRIVSLLKGDAPDMLPPDEPCIVLAYDLTPYQAAMLAKGKVMGIATIHGGASSHTAIITR